MSADDNKTPEVNEPVNVTHIEQGVTMVNQVYDTTDALVEEEICDLKNITICDKYKFGCRVELSAGEQLKLDSLAVKLNMPGMAKAMKLPENERKKALANVQFDTAVDMHAFTLRKLLYSVKTWNLTKRDKNGKIIPLEISERNISKMKGHIFNPLKDFIDKIQAAPLSKDSVGN